MSNSFQPIMKINEGFSSNIIDIHMPICHTFPMIRTTLRLHPTLKYQAQQYALENSLTLQDVFNRALKLFIETTHTTQAKKKIHFKTHDLKAPLDNLRRDDYYPPVSSI